ncbi:putative magnesium transporter NIPA8 [Drosera capensis]
MGEWVVGAFINLYGSIAINFGTNLLKLGHTETGYVVWSELFAIYTPGQLAEKYCNIAFLLYCFALILIVAVHHYIYRRGELLFAIPGHEPKGYWQMLLPYSYAVVSGAIGSCSVLFAKSLSNLIRLAMSSAYQLHTWFTYSMFLLFLSTAGFWMARLNQGLSLFDAILIVPMFQIVWTLFSICTGFVYFQEYQVFNTLRTTMFILGMISVFIGISLLAPDEEKGSDIKDNSTLDHITPTIVSSNESRPPMPLEDVQADEMKPFWGKLATKAMNFVVKAKLACLLSLGLGKDSIDASSVLAMPMVSSKMTGFRGGTVERTKFFPMRSHGWSKIPMNGDDEDGVKLLETSTLHSQGV